MAGRGKLAGMLLALGLLCAAPAVAECNAAAERKLQQGLAQTQAFAWVDAVASFNSVTEADKACTTDRWSPIALDRLEYADLQTGRDDAAKALLSQGDDPTRAILAARYALERDAWGEAAALAMPDSTNFEALAVVHFARTLGAAREGRAAAAKLELGALEGVEAANERNVIDAAKAWVTLAEGHREAALALMRAAADREDAAIGGGPAENPLLPMRELLADMLIVTEDYGGALREYEVSLSHAPGRMRAFWGAGRAAEDAGDRVKTQHYYAEFAALCGAGTCQRPGRLTALKRSMAHP